MYTEIIQTLEVTAMNEGTSKNIIILLLIGMVLGLIVVLFAVTQDGLVSNMQEISEDALDETKDLPLTDEEETEDAPQAKVVLPEAAIPSTLSPTTQTENTPRAESQVVADGSTVIVTYTDSGFIPPVVEVRAGGNVTFINSSSKPMWVTSENHPTAKGQIYRGFDQGKSVAKGETYTFNFTQVGVWGYKNLNLDKHLGAISVIAQ